MQDSQKRPSVLTFDIMGTLFDWHSGIQSALSELTGAGLAEPTQGWAEVSREYRRRSLERIRGAVAPHGNFDDVLRATQKELLADNGVALAPDAAEQVFGAWSRLPVWPDVIEGLRRLRSVAHIMPFTVVSEAMAKQLAEVNGITWDGVISCEELGVYKTHPDAYRKAAERLGLSPGEITLVACHDFDLAAAQAVGYNTVYISRPREWGEVTGPSSGAEVAQKYDSLLEFAASFGV